MTVESSRAGKRALQVARAIESEIQDLGWPVGLSLGSEQALIERFEVSRAVLREAIRIVESHGVAEMRLGPGGGLTVTEPTRQVALETLSLLLNHARATLTNLIEACEAIELAAVALAAERITEEGIVELRDLIERPGNRRAELPAYGWCGEVHGAIARAAQNPALELLADVLPGLAACHKPASASEATDDDEVHGAHAAIVAAIVAGDVALAQHRMRRHLSQRKIALGIRDDCPDPAAPDVPSSGDASRVGSGRAS